MELNYNAVLGDNNAGAGRVSTKRITVKVAHTGPFKVTRPLRDDVLLEMKIIPSDGWVEKLLLPQLGLRKLTFCYLLMEAPFFEKLSQKQIMAVGRS